MRRPRRQPQRRCVACGGAAAKRTLVRVVRTPTGEVRVDPTGKAAGRGAYLCPDAACVALALKKSALERALRASVPPDIRAALEAVAAHPNSLAARPPAPAEQTG